MSELNIVVISGVIITSIILAIRYRQPLVFWLLLIGVVSGTHGIGLISNDSTIQTISELGSILLLFTIGVKFSINKLLKQGFKIILFSILKIVFITIPVFVFSLLFGFSSLTSIIIAFCASITSTAIAIKMIENREMNHEDVSFMVNMLIVEDIMAVFILTFVSGFQNLSVQFVAYQLLVTILLLAFTYIICMFAIVPITKWVIKNSNDDVIPFVAISLMVGLSYLTSKMGLSASAGAFLGGSIVNFLPKSDDFEFSISTFTLVFSSIFFISIGTLVDLSAIPSILLPLIGLIIIIFFAKFIVVSLLSKIYGFEAENAVPIGIIMLPIGEFSLLIAKEALNLGVDVVSLVSILILATSLISSLTLNNSTILIVQMKRFLSINFLN